MLELMPPPVAPLRGSLTAVYLTLLSSPGLLRRRTIVRWSRGPRRGIVDGEK